MSDAVQPIIDSTLNIKLGNSTHEEFDAVVKKTKAKKAAGLDNIPPAENTGFQWWPP